MEIPRIKSRGCAEPFCIENREHVVVQSNQAFGSKPLQHPVDVNGSEAECVSKFRLCKRESEVTIRNQANTLHASVQFTHLMRKAGIRVTSTQVNDPGSKNRFVR